MLNKFVKDLTAFLSITQMTFTAATYVGWKDQMKIRQMLTKGSIIYTSSFGKKSLMRDKLLIKK